MKLGRRSAHVLHFGICLGFFTINSFSKPVMSGIGCSKGTGSAGSWGVTAFDRAGPAWRG